MTAMFLNQKRNLNNLIIMQVKDKEKKLKPIKQPVKPTRSLLGAIKQPTEGHHQGAFKESMQRSKGAANMVSSTLPQQPKINTLENVCTNLLQMGMVQSYIDLFYISHKCIPNVMKKKNYFGDQIRIPDGISDSNEENLLFYKELGQSLSKAEVRPQSLLQQKQASMNDYNSMAFNYEDQGNFTTACYFYNKVIDIASSCKNKQFELVAQLGLGKCYDQQNLKDQAIDLLQDAFDDACIIENAEQRAEMTKLIGKELIQIYMKKASQYERLDEKLGLQAYANALRIAKKSNQLESEARISHKIGQLYYEEGNFQKSVQYQQNYLELLKRSLDEEFERMNSDEMGEKKDFTQEKVKLKFKQMEAHASLAKCYLKLKNIEKAQNHLNNYHKMAKESKAQNSIADSSYYLAKLFEEKKQKQKAITYYQSYFQAAKSEKPDKKDRKLVDKARVTFAIAKANRNMDRYIAMMSEQDSLVKVLDWKIKRVLK